MTERMRASRRLAVVFLETVNPYIHKNKPVRQTKTDKRNKQNNGEMRWEQVTPGREKEDINTPSVKSFRMVGIFF